MAYSKIKKILFILLCVFIILFPFWCVRGLCSEEDLNTVDYEVINNLSCPASTNYFVSSDGNVVYYFPAEPGYIYHFKSNYNSAWMKVGFCNDIPGVNVVFTYSANVPAGQEVSLIPDSNYVYICGNMISESNPIIITKEKVSNQDGVINDLVSNVGLDSIWGIFDNSINFIYIAIAFAFGFGLITLLIKKISKGSE